MPQIDLLIEHNQRRQLMNAEGLVHKTEEILEEIYSIFALVSIFLLTIVVYTSVC